MTRPFQSAARSRSACTISIAASLANKPNARVAVTLSVANHNASLPIAYRLYLPQKWAKDAGRRKKARIPREISFKTKPQIALEQIREALAAGIPQGTVLADASYGSNSEFRIGVSALGLKYVAAIIPTFMGPRVSNDGAQGPPQGAKTLGRSRPKKAWRTITWREGTNAKLRSRFPAFKCARHRSGAPQHETKKHC